MQKINLLVVLAFVIGTAHCAGPLFLTNYLEKGQVAQAQKLARVNPLYFFGLPSYAGYFTTNTTYNSNLFFWFFPAKINPSKAPVVLWLQGGPGGSSLYGLFMENGPFYVTTRNTLALRSNSWTQNHNMLFIDNPVGTGFSFTDNPAGYARNEDDVGSSLFSAVRQFYMLFPELRSTGFYAAGESYAGKYLPALGHAIYQKRSSSDYRDKINLKGIAIGNGVTDPINQINYGQYLYQLGMIDEPTLNIFLSAQKNATDYLNANNYLGALAVLSPVINTAGSLLETQTGFTSTYNFLVPDGYNPTIALVGNFIKNSGLGEIVNVGSKPFAAYSDTNIVLQYLYNDIMQSVRPWVEELIENYPIMIYNGQLDVLVGYVITENYVQRLNWSGAAAYKTAKRNIWRVDGEIAGYVKQVGYLTRVMIRDAGHMAAADQPKWLLNMLMTMTYGQKFN